MSLDLAIAWGVLLVALAALIDACMKWGPRG